jgi:hypothetical protein
MKPWPAYLIAFPALLGCGARPSLELGSGAPSEPTSTSSSSSSSGSVPTLAVIGNDCAPDDGRAIRLMVTGSQSCPASEAPGVEAYIWGTDLAGLHAGDTLTVGVSIDANTTAWRVVTPGDQIQANGGTITFTSFVAEAAATGTFALDFTDGTSQRGAFTATWCPTGITCG